MNKNKIRKGLIVIVKNNTAQGNLTGSITKVLGKPGEISDTLFLATGRKEDPLLRNFVLCETTPKVQQVSVTYNNKPAFYQKIDGLELANIHEKQAYAEGIRHIDDIEITERVTKENVNLDNPW